MRVFVGIGALLMAFLAGAALARADGKRDLEDGIAFYNNLDTERARARLKAAVESQDLPPELHARGFLYLGLLEFETGAQTKAEASFRTALGHDVHVKVPEGTSPKIVEVIESLRAEVQAKALPSGSSAPDASLSSDVTELVPPAPSHAPVLAVSPEPEREGGVSPWVWAGIGGGVLVAAVVVVVLVASGGNDCEGAGGCVNVRFQ